MINYLGGLKREIHDIKVEGSDGGFEPAMVIRMEGHMGRSFIIPLDCFWKYIEPDDNLDATDSDMKEFKKIMDRINFTLVLTGGMVPEPDSRKLAKIDLGHYFLAASLHKSMGVLPSVCWNLVKCLAMFEITVIPQSAAQLLLWIQNGLEDMKNYRPASPPEAVGVAGEVNLMVDGQAVATKQIEVMEDEDVEFTNQERAEFVA